MSLSARQAALPSDHGSWVFLLLPLIAGLALGGRPTAASGSLVVGVLGGFLARQPLTLAARVAGGRRPRTDLPTALRWIAIWGALGVAGALGLLLVDRGALLWLAAPAVPVLGFQLHLVSRRAERRRPGLEIAGAALLALAAPASYWCGEASSGIGSRQGWVLWAVLALQAAASILHVHALLVRRGGADSRRADLGAVVVGLVAPILSWPWAGWIAVALVPQAVENLLGRRRSLEGVRPTAVGLRQLWVSVLAGVLLIGVRLAEG